MKTPKLLCTLGLLVGLPFLAIGQTTPEAASPTRSADGGVQTVKTAEDPKVTDAEKPVTDPPHLSKTNTQTGGAVDTGTPKDNVDKNSNVDPAKDASKTE